VKGFVLRVREAVGRGKEDGKSGGWVAELFLGEGGRGKGMMFCGLDWVRKGRGEDWVSGIV
jgi:hypothetical protein